MASDHEREKLVRNPATSETNLPGSLPRLIPLHPLVLARQAEAQNKRLGRGTALLKNASMELRL